MGACKKILVVEDNRDVREAVVEVLQSEGFTVESAPDGRAGLERLKEEKDSTLVFLDLMMPQKNGWEFLEELRMPGNQVLPKHRVVTISAVRASLSLEDPISLEVDGVIRKPLDVDRILDEAQKYCVPCGQKT